MTGPRDFKMSVKADALVEVRLGGWITEASNLDLSQIPEGRPVVLDVGDVRLINSLGCRDWMRFLASLCARAPTVTIRRLSPMLAFHASTIRNFLAQARVESMLTPWACTKCPHQMDFLQDAAAAVPISLPCPKCGLAMELDTFLGVYDNIENIKRAE